MVSYRKLLREARRFSLIGCLLIPTLSAQQPLRETVVVTANAYPVPFNNVSRSVTVLTSEQISRLPVHSVPELLRYAASLDVRSRGPLGVQSDFLARGAGFGQALILVNGFRINDTQSGHHNGDIPVMLEDIERIEVLYGPGSSLHGADAFGGTINIITRKPGERGKARFTVGDFGFFQGAAGAGFGKNGIQQSVTASADRSHGFMFARDFQTVGFTSQTGWGKDSSLLVSYLWKEFGANGFYGPSPSREWTNSTLVTLNQPFFRRNSWDLTGKFFYRTHGDHFLWDFRRPGFAENRHRTHAIGGSAQAHWNFSEKTNLTMGVETGGDWIRSNNLGDHEFSKSSAFAEVQFALSDRVSIYPGVRYDYYSNFVSSTNPSVSASWWATPTFKIRSAVGRAFRIPTFTELYYRDPNHQANSNLAPEKAWGAEAGADWMFHPQWVGSLTLFSRWERNVIDWVRDTPKQKWQTTNVRRLENRGVELGIQHLLHGGSHVEFQYAYLNTEATPVAYLSKYVLDYSRHSFSGFFSLHLPQSFSFGQRVDYKRRVDGRDYWVLDGRLARSFGKVNLYIECLNMLDSDYQEIQGVDMPGRWFLGGLELTVR